MLVGNPNLTTLARTSFISMISRSIEHQVVYCKEDKLLPFIERFNIVKGSSLVRVEKQIAIPGVPKVPDIDAAPPSFLKAAALAFDGWILVNRFKVCIEFIKML